MKRKRFLIAIIMIAASSLTASAQWYGANDAGISIEKKMISAYDFMIDTNNQQVIITGEHTEEIKIISWALGLKFGYQYNQFVGEVSGKINLMMQGDISLMAGYKIGDVSNDHKHPGFSFTPLIGTDLMHFNYAGRIQFDHFIIEASRMNKTTWLAAGFKCYLSE